MQLTGSVRRANAEQHSWHCARRVLFPSLCPEVSVLGADTQKVALLLGRQCLPTGSWWGHFPYGIKRFDPLLSLQPLPAHGCHPCLLSRSLASTVGRRGQNQFATGLRTGSVGPTTNYRASAFCRSSQHHTFVHPAGSEQENSTIVLLWVNKKKHHTHHTEGGQAQWIRGGCTLTGALDICII